MRIFKSIKIGFSTAVDLIRGLYNGPYWWLAPVVLLLLPPRSSSSSCRRSRTSRRSSIRSSDRLGGVNA